MTTKTTVPATVLTTIGPRPRLTLSRPNITSLRIGVLETKITMSAISTNQFSFATGELNPASKREHPLISGLKDDVEKLLDDLGDFKAFLKEAGKVRYDNDILKRLIAKIRTVVNKAEDIIDKYVVATRSHYDNKWKRYLDIEHPGRKLELAKDIQMIRSSMERIRKEPAFDLDVLRYEALPNRGPRQIEMFNYH
nr:putative late blight resistance protein homolog R1A-3 [Ipomoea batatas]